MNRSQRIAIWVLTLIGLLAAWKLFGQGFGNFRTDQPFLARNYPAADNSSPSSIGGIFTWWVYTDLATNGISVTNWPDKVRGLVLSNQYTAPISTPLGVYVDNTSGLRQWEGTNAFGITADTTTCLIFRPEENADYSVLMRDNTGAGFNIRRTDSTYPGSWSAGGATEAIAFKNLELAKYYDVVIIRTNNESITIYTNGVVSAYNNISRPGVTTVPLEVGCSGASGTLGLRGYVAEVLYFTNAFAALDLAKFHRYATNTYRYSP